MAIVNSKIIDETDETIIVEFTFRRWTRTISIEKKEGFTTEELLKRWTRRMKMKAFPLSKIINSYRLLINGALYGGYKQRCIN
jgi:hypothetical protein